MFSNFLYFITALVIYTTSELFETTNTFDNSVLFKALMVNIFFIVICHITFDRLGKKIKTDPYAYFDHLINSYISRLSIFALIIFAINLYGFKLNFYFSQITFFDLIPTAEAIIFLSLFIFYLIIIWSSAYDVQKHNFAGKISKKDFIISNLSFSLPALLPWFCLSIIADLLKFLPWQGLNNLLNTTAGEIGYIAIFIVAISILGPVLIQKLWNCKPLEPGEPRTKIENVCNQAKLKYADILKWELFGGTTSSTIGITAGVMGIIARFRYILVTPALLHLLNDDEINAVIQHEIGHVKKHHMIFYLLFFAGFIACNFLFFEPVMLLLYIIEPVYKIFEFFGVNKETAHPVMISATLIGSFILYFRFVFGFFMRNFERQADLHVYNFTNDPSSLISTFYKIAYFSGQSAKQDMDNPNWHHFSIGQRIRFLEKCKINPELIQNHHLRIKKLITGYFVLIAMLIVTGYSINFGVAKDTFGNFIAEKILYQQLEVNPENSDLYVVVGDYYYNKKNYEKAISSYENVLKVDPDNVHALNNLAWLFATCLKKEFQNREKALQYSIKALEQKREAFILDTYAQACFMNNDIKNAVKAAREALYISKDKKEYYKNQLIKFSQELNSNR